MDIKVIKDIPDVVDITRMSDEDREAMFEAIAAKNPQLSKAALDSFSQLLLEYTYDKINFTKPTILELLLRKVIQLGNCDYNTSSMNTFVIPIIALKALDTAEMQPSGQNAAKSSEEAHAPETPMAAEGAWIGGAMKPFARSWRKNAPKVEQVAGAIRIRLDSRVLNITSNGAEYISSENEELNVVGIIVGIECSPDVKIKDQPAAKLSSVFIKEISEDRFIIGNYNYKYISDKYFIAPKYRLRIGGVVYDSTAHFNLLGNSQEHNQQLLSDIYEYIYARNSSVNLTATSYYLQTLLATEYGGIYNKEIASRLSRDNLTAKLALRKIFVYSPMITMPLEPIPPLSKELVAISEVIVGTLNPLYITNVLSDLRQYMLTSVYNRARIFGVDSKEVSAALQVYRANIERWQYQARLHSQALIERNNEVALELITEKKFGQKRYHELLHLAAGRSILTAMKPNEKKIIETERERREKFFDAVINNKCPHIKLYKKFRNSVRAQEMAAAYGELSKFFARDAAKDSMIKCNNCGFDILCPHIKTLYELEGRDVSTVTSALMKYIEDIPVHDQYFCKICHEVLSTPDMFHTVSMLPGTTMSEELRTMIYSEIMFEIRLLKFSTVINVQQLVNTIRNAIYPYIADIEKQILKSRTASAEEIKSKKKLYISIYCFAYIIHLIVDNPANADKIWFKGLKKTGPVRKNTAVDLIKHALGVLVSSKNIIIKNIPGMTPDILKTKLIEVYKQLSSKDYVVQYSMDVESIKVTASMDPLYEYLYCAKIYSDILSGKYSHGKKHISPTDMIESVLGKSLKALEGGKSIYATAPIPKFQKDLTKEFDSLCSENDSATGELSIATLIDTRKIVTNARLNRIYTGLFIRNFTHFWKFVAGEMYKYNTPGAEIDAVALTEYYNELSLIRKCESVYRKLLMLYSSHNVRCISADKTTQYAGMRTKLGRMYDESGREHEFDILIYADPEDPKKQIEMGFKSAAEAPFSKRFESLPADRKCSTCGILRSECDKLSDDKIMNSLDEHVDRENLFRFYENRCPIDNLHDFATADGQTKCIKCKLTTSMLNDISGSSAIAYYKEYKSKYDKERDDFAPKDALKFAPAVEFNPHDEYKDEISKWVFNFDIVLELSDKLKVNHRAIMALGAIEGLDYADVLNGIFTPPEIQRRDDTRIYTLNGFIKEFLTDYNRLRHFSRIGGQSQELLELIENSGISREQISMLDKLLPDIFDGHNDKFVQFKRIRKPREIPYYCIQKLCQYALSVLDYGGEHATTTAQLRKNFVQMVINRILRSDELRTKHSHFNWSLLFPDETKMELVDRDYNYTEDQSELERPDTDDIDDADSASGATNEAFMHLEDIDVEGEYTGEDDGNQIRVEGYELD
jgi:hypothetical protein